MADCVDYPGLPGTENMPSAPVFVCKEGIEAVPNCPMTGFSGCEGPVPAACCSIITQLCQAAHPSSCPATGYIQAISAT